MIISPANYYSTLPLKMRFFFSIGVILSLLLLLSISSYLLQLSTEGLRLGPP